MTAVWHGTVYGKTGNGAVTLNAVTGQDVPTDPEVAPVLVNSYAGVALSSASGSALAVYPVIG
ncbi:hypothetical protein [Kitasatospora sp. NPDC001683]